MIYLVATTTDKEMAISLSVHIKPGALKELSSSKLCASKIHEDFFSVASISASHSGHHFFNRCA